MDGSVEFAHVSYTLPLPSGGGRSISLFRDVSLKLEAGTTTALLGRSGSGKTTLLRMVNGLVKPSTGEVFVAGAPVSQADLLTLRRGIGYVIQETGLFPHMSVQRNAGLALELAGWSPTNVVARAGEVLSLAGIHLSDLGERYPWQLSGGQRQRVGLARALALDPSVLLMDEPFGALDPLTRAEMQTMLKHLLAKVRKTVLLVTHDLDEALFLAHRVIFLHHGEVVADLPCEDVLASGNSQVQAYVRAVHSAVRA